MKVNGQMIHREIAGEHILIPVGETALTIHGMITLTESGVLLWECLQKDCTEDDLVDALLKEYDVDRETALADVRGFVGKVDALGILVKE